MVGLQAAAPTRGHGPRGAAENTAKKQRGRPFRPDRSGNPQGRPRRRDRSNVFCGAGQITVAKFANRRNSHCVTMAGLDHAKLANSLMRKASHSSLGSASDFNSFASAGRAWLRTVPAPRLPAPVKAKQLCCGVAYPVRSPIESVPRTPN